MTIYRNTARCNRERWNDKAIDYRYLSERLRTLQYLPRAASLHSLRPKSVQFATAVLRQNVVECLFNTIVRQAPPETGLVHVPVGAGGNGALARPRIVSPDLADVASLVRRAWLHAQRGYHHDTTRRYGTLHHTTERWVARINLLVVRVVVVDLLILTAVVVSVAFGAESALVARLHALGPLLIGLAAFLPAVVASLNGFLFQSEAKRIGERSKITNDVLKYLDHEWESFSNSLPLTSSREGTRAKRSGRVGVETMDLLGGDRPGDDELNGQWSVLYSRDVPRRNRSPYGR